MTFNILILLYLTMIFMNKSYYQPLVQMWVVTKDIIIEKLQKMLLKDE